MKRSKIAISALMLAVVIGTGCASQNTRTTETTTSTEPADKTPPPAVATQSTTTTTTEDTGHSSLLGATANFVWTAVSLPFRIVGDVIGEIV
jgi:hypothetical protein